MSLLTHSTTLEIYSFISHPCVNVSNENRHHQRLHSFLLSPFAYSFQALVLFYSANRTVALKNMVIQPKEAKGRLLSEIDSSCALVSLILANNETGVLQPLDEIAAIAHEGGALLHVDAAQIGGRLPAPAAWDLLSISGHKAGGLKGAGALLCRPGISLAPQLLGGPQERGQRAGTVDVPAVVGLAEALSLSWNSARLGDLRDDLESFAVSRGAFVYGQGAPRLPNTSLLCFEGVEGQTLALALDLEGVCVSTGSACASGASEPSAVLAAMGWDPRSGLRFSLGWSTTQEEIEATKAALETVLSRIEATVAVAL